MRQFNSLLKANQVAMLNDLGRGAYNRVKKPLKGSVKRAVKWERATSAKQSVRVYTDSPIAIFREVNTKAHRITAKRAKALRFKPKGTRKFLFRHSVWHPGTKGTHSWQYSQKQFNMRLPFALNAMLEATTKGLRYSKRYS